MGFIREAGRKIKQLIYEQNSATTFMQTLPISYLTEAD